MQLKGQAESLYLVHALADKVASGQISQAEMDRRLKRFDDSLIEIFERKTAENLTPQEVNKLIVDVAVDCAGGALYPFTEGAPRPSSFPSLSAGRRRENHTTVRQRSKGRTVTGCILIGMQIIGIIGSGINDSLHFFGEGSFSSLGVFFYDFLQFVGYFLPSIIGLILILVKTKPKSLEFQVVDNNPRPSGTVAHTVPPPVITASASDINKMSEPKAQKERFCKICGGRIEHESKKCIRCGKQYFNLRRFFRPKFFLIVGFAVVLIILCCYSYTRINDLKLELNDVKQLSEAQHQQIEELNAKVEELSEKNLENIGAISKLNLEKSELKNAADTYKDLWIKAYDYQQFMDNYIVLVPSSGEYQYHKYGCFAMRGESFFAYNINKAVALGYAPCKYCVD